MKKMNYEANRCIKLSAICMVCAVMSGSALQPDDIEGLALWLDAADLNTLTVDSTGRVSAWADKANGTADSMTMTTADNQPLAAAVFLNGFNVLQFDGNDWFEGNAFLTEGDDDYTYIALWRSYKTSGAQVVLEQGSGDDQRASMLLVNSAYGFNGQGNDKHNLVPFTANTWHLALMEVANSWPANISIYDNDDFYLGSTSKPENLHIGTQGSRVAAKVQNNAENFLGEIAEIIVYDRLISDTHRNAVQHYLSQKWGLALENEVCDEIIDFEHGVVPDGWQATGVFTNQPVSSTRQNFNKHGGFLLDSYSGQTNGIDFGVGNAPTGELSSATFVLSNNTVRARLGGGHLGASVQFQLQRLNENLNWEVVRRSTGTSDNFMRELVWNTHNLIGETVRFHMLDKADISLGLVILDYIRLLDYPLRREIITDFSGNEFAPGIYPECKVNSVDIGLTGNGSAYMEFSVTNYSYDAWILHDKAPKILISTVSDDNFELSTRICSRSLSNYKSQAGLGLYFEKTTGVDEYAFDPVMFGAYKDQEIRLEWPALDLRQGITFDYTITNVYLRIKRSNDKFSFQYSEEGEEWITLVEQEYPDAVLINAGLFSKRWNSTPAATQRVEFDSLSYLATPKIPGTIILVR